jgi:hypothetical protein
MDSSCGDIDIGAPANFRASDAELFCKLDLRQEWGD